MTSQSILVTGAGGQLGQELRAWSALYPDWNFSFFDRAQMPLDDAVTLEAAFAEVQPDACINAAAYTAVDKAESEPDQAFAVNAAGVERLAGLCKLHGAVLLHVSTDFVFDGTSKRPYKEQDPVGPLNVYGQSKLEGERLSRQAHDRVVIVRTSWVYSFFGKNFVKTMMRLLNERPTLGVVDDQVGRPTYAADLAKVLLDILEAYFRLSPENRAIDPRFNSTYHFADKGTVTWFELARAIAESMRSNCVLKPLLTEEYPTPAQRPGYSVLDTSKIEHTFGVRPPPWRASLVRCLELLMR